MGAIAPAEDGRRRVVTARHPVRSDWHEIYRAIVPGGSCFAQHVGPASALELIEYFLGALPEERELWDAAIEKAAAEEAGLEVVQLRTVRGRMEFFGVSAVCGRCGSAYSHTPDFQIPQQQ